MNADHGYPTLPRLLIVGPGRVGRALERAGLAAGLDLRLVGRDELARARTDAEVVLLCVPDASIAEAWRSVATSPGLRFAGHTSGASGLDALSGAAERGVRAFSIHPLQTVPDGEAELRGAPCAVSGSDKEAVELARRLANAFGMHAFEVAEQSRAAYHAAASMASNFLVALEESAGELLRRSGIEAPRELLAPLVLRTAANWSERGAEALTGPIARGDEATVDRHLEALAERCPELLETYRALAERTRAIAATKASA